MEAQSPRANAKCQMMAHVSDLKVLARLWLGP